ncbi:MAG: hypothetical protein ACREYF_11540 [Gammaproteobacteria bacterium]
MRTEKYSILAGRRFQEAGVDPLDVLIKLMDDPKMTPEVRRKAAKAIRSYLYARPGLPPQVRQALEESRGGSEGKRGG